MIAIIISTLKSLEKEMPDYAGLNDKKQLLAFYPFVETEEIFDGHAVYVLDPDSAHAAAIDEEVRIYTVDGGSISHEHLDTRIAADLFIFATTHSSVSGIPTMTVHTQGNWGRADTYGGSSRTLAVGIPWLIKRCMQNMEQFKGDLDFDVVMEATHHGPAMEKPCMFIEVGSTQKEWQMPEPAGVVMKSLMEALKDRKEYRTAVGIGGQHTTPNFKKILLGEEVALCHVCPKYMLDALDEEMLMQAIEKTQPKATLIILDWKGLGAENKERILALCEKTGLEIKRTSDFL